MAIKHSSSKVTEIFLLFSGFLQFPNHVSILLPEQHKSAFSVSSRLVTLMHITNVIQRHKAIC